MRILLAFFLLASSASASPLKKIVHVLTNHVTVDFYAGAASGFASGGTFYCRTHNPDVEHCSEKYGAAGQFEVARGVWTLSMIALSEYGRKQKFKEWFVPALAVGTFNIYWGIREFRTKEKKE